MKILSDFIDRQLAPLWDSRFGGVWAALASGFSCWLLLTIKLGNATVNVPCGVTISIIVLTTWWLQHRLPRVPSGKIGVLVGIACEDDEEAKRINEDFVSELRTLLLNDRACAQFYVAVLSRYWSKRAANPDETARILERSRGHLIFFGSAKRRELQSKPTHCLSLSTMMRHVPVPRPASDALAQVIGESLPHKIWIPVDGDALAFELTSRWVSMGAKFAVGVAAGFGGNLPYAEMLFLDVERQLILAGPAAIFLRPLARHVPRHLSLLYMAWLASLTEQYYLKRKKDVLKQAESIADKIIARDPAIGGPYLTKAMAAFVFSRDLPRARSFVSQAMSGMTDTVCNYCLAFLYGYEGKLREAHAEYKSAFRRIPANPTVPIQCEEFIHIIIQEEPDKAHLLFCTGLINYNAKMDYDAAKRDFGGFLELTDSSRFATARKKAEELRGRCEGKKAAAIALLEYDDPAGFPITAAA